MATLVVAMIYEPPSNNSSESGFAGLWVVSRCSVGLENWTYKGWELNGRWTISCSVGSANLIAISMVFNHPALTFERFLSTPH